MKRLISIVLVLALVLATPAAFAEEEMVKDRDYYYAMLDALVEVIEELGLYYEDGTNVALETLADYFELYPERFVEFANMMYESQDPYSHFMEPVKYESSYVMNDTYVGIGIEFDAEKASGLHVINVFPGSPAEEAGIKIGDEIIGVDGTDVSGMHYSQVSPLIRGEAETTVEITVARDSTELTTTVTRRLITLSNIDFRDLGNGVAYVRITRFGDLATFSDFLSVYMNLPYDGFRSVIYDVRDNMGGSVDTLLNILNYAMWVKNAEAFSMVSRTYGHEVYRSLGAGWKPNGVYVLINENSASAAEMFTIALQSLGAVAIGTNTYGKGLGQSHISFVDGSTAVITDFAIYGPNDVSYNEVGVTPDIYVRDGFAPLYRNRELAVGDEGDDVFGLEERLYALGYLSEMPDSVMDENTLKAVWSFERSFGIPTRDVATVNTMLEIIREARVHESSYGGVDRPLAIALELAREDAKYPIETELTPRTFEEWDEWYGE